MLIPDRIERGVNQGGGVTTHVWYRDTLQLNGRTFGAGAAAFKTDSIMAIGVSIFSLVYYTVGVNTTIRLVPMDEQDALEMPGSLLVATVPAAGLGFTTFGASPVIILTSFKLQFTAAAGTNTVTAALFGRS